MVGLIEIVVEVIFAVGGNSSSNSSRRGSGSNGSSGSGCSSHCCSSIRVEVVSLNGWFATRYLVVSLRFFPPSLPPSLLHSFACLPARMPRLREHRPLCGTLPEPAPACAGLMVVSAHVSTRKSSDFGAGTTILFDSDTFYF